MRSAMQEWGPDRNGTWHKGAAGLGSLTLFNTPEAVHEQLPLESPQGFVLTAEARLDNRDELCAELAIAAADRGALPDGSLILRAYERWGEHTPQHLIGDWSFAAWHPEQKRLFLARDHFGNTSLYYYHDDRRFAFASSRRALLTLGIPRRLNEFYLACVLVSWSAHHGSQTIELDMHRLPPAHTLKMQEGRLQIDQYWRLEDTPLLHLQDNREYVEAFLPIYDRAVRERLRSKADIGVTLSGGLDSGSATGLAARALRESHRRLKAYTSAPIHDVGDAADAFRFADELPFAQSTAAFAGNVDLTIIRGVNTTPVQAMRRGLEIHAEPGHAAGNAYWIHDLLDTAQRDGIGTLLTGQGGNATISWTGLNRARRLTNMLKTGDWKRLLQALVYPRLPLPILRRLRSALHRGGLNWSGTSINADLARRLDLDAAYIAGTGKLSNPEDWFSPIRHRHAIIKPGESFLGAIWAETGAAYSMEVRDPTFDKRLMEFTLSIPDREFLGPDGYDRWIIRSAMQGIMPDDIRLNRRRGRQAGDLHQRLLDSAAEVDGALAEIAASPLAQQCLSLTRMREVWQDIHDNADSRSAHRAVTILTRGMMAGLFLVDFEKQAHTA